MCGWGGNACGVWAERQSVTARQRTTLCVCVGVVWCEGPCVCVCVRGGGCVWCGRHGWVGGQRQAERHSQAKDNAVCVCVCVCVCVVWGEGVCVCVYAVCVVCVCLYVAQ